MNRRYWRFAGVVPVRHNVILELEADIDLQRLPRRRPVSVVIQKKVRRYLHIRRIPLLLRARAQVRQIRVQIVRRLARAVPAEPCSRVRDFVEILLLLPLQNRIRVVASARVHDDRVVRFRQLDHVRADAADRPDRPVIRLVALENRDQPRNAAFRQHFPHHVGVRQTGLGPSRSQIVDDDRQRPQLRLLIARHPGQRREDGRLLRLGLRFLHDDRRLRLRLLFHGSAVVFLAAAARSEQQHQQRRQEKRRHPGDSRVVHGIGSLLVVLFFTPMSLLNHRTRPIVRPFPTKCAPHSTSRPPVPKQ